MRLGAVSMGINLFEHNKVAYKAALEMLHETGKSAVIHPTGTGKSFIGFKLCENYPEANICWLSPSEYIFKTQLENLKATSDGFEPDNITFLTYAKLMNMSDKEVSALQPNYIILDEFHRCGAAQWGKGVQKLISRYSYAPILGLSATNIRYLDNQRDMADELFEGNVASQITLGAAIVRGILLPPTYITTVFSYQEELERYQDRVVHAKSKSVRNTGDKYLEALRRTLSKADGLDVVFEKHIRDKSAKFIVFCANKVHMDEMKSHVGEFFGRIDKAPHVYSVYSDDPEASSDFAEFKADESEHLKLLFCIDMLNEGVHVDNISGVILFRPTVSPIIYKQQIGRALSASKTRAPLIFDIVNNFKNLYSIGTIEQEMQVAINYYRFNNSDQEIVTERFEVIDESQDCRKLFSKLNETLTASWDLMYEEAKKYEQQHGTLEVPKRYKTKSGYSLGTWLITQRRVRSGNIYGALDEARIKKLDDIGMIWETMRDFSWERNLAEAKSYFIKYGNLDIDVNYMTETGLALGRWICQTRTYRKNGIHCGYLTQNRINALDDIHMIWDIPDYLWEKNYFAAMEYYKKYGNLDVAATYISHDGLNLSNWLCKLRNIKNGKIAGQVLSEDQLKRLDLIGMIWTDKYARSWEAGYAAAKEYYERHGDLDVSPTYVTPYDYHLGAWIAHHRDKRGIKVTPERQAKLDALGMIWIKPDAWQIRYNLVKKYYEEYGNLNIPQKYTADGVWLNKWLNEQKQVYHGKRKGQSLSVEQINLLEAIGCDWMGNKERTWLLQYQSACAYYKRYGNLDVPKTYKTENGTYLANWIIVQRKQYKDAKLTQKQIKMLSEIGMVWDGFMKTRKHTIRGCVQDDDSGVGAAL